MICATLPINFFLNSVLLNGEFSCRPSDHHLALSGGPTEVLVDWGHRTTLISSPEKDNCFHDYLCCVGPLWVGLLNNRPYNAFHKNVSRTFKSGIQMQM